MMRATAFGLCLFFLTANAYADPVPLAALNKDFQTCMGNESASQDPERAEYCGCIRDTMKGWSIEAYQELAMEGAKAQSAAQEPQKLQEIAKACIAKVMGGQTH